jgi:hypothetical protein
MRIYHTTETFIERANQIHKWFYTYTKTIFVKTHQKVIITCPIHGDFEQIPKDHLNGKGCKNCWFDKHTKLQTDTKESFIQKALEIQFNKSYDYSCVVYTGSKQKVEIICPVHGSFWQAPNDHLSGKQCFICARESCASFTRKLPEKFIVDANSVHGSFDYQNSDYINSSTPIKIICSIHGEFLQRPSNHLQGQGCPNCNLSQGERHISKFLISNKICYKQQVKIPKCRNKKPLPFDFGIYENNKLIGLIEYHGRQHYVPISHFGGNIELVKRQKNDQIKQNFCKDNNIPLLVISYTEIKFIEERINKFVGK